MVEQPDSPDSHHPGRVAFLTRAAYASGVTEAERTILIRHGAPGKAQAEVLAKLREAYRLHQDRHGTEAAAILRELAES